MLTRIQQSDSSRCQSSDSEEKGEDQRTLPWPTGISDVKKKKKSREERKKAEGEVRREYRDFKDNQYEDTTGGKDADLFRTCLLCALFRALRHKD